MYSIETRIKALAVAGLMAASVAGSTMTAFAAPAYTLNDATGVPVSKEVKVADGITLPTNTKFNFTATFKASSNKENGLGGAPNEFTVTTDEMVAKTKLTDEKKIAAADEFKNAVPGEYVYSLTEKEKTKLTNGYGWICDTSEYVLRVYVDKDHKVQYTVLKGNKYDLNVESLDNLKLDKASFSNVYRATGGGKDDAAALVVDKKVEGDYGNTSQYFKFTVTFDTPDTETVNDKTEKRKFKMTFTGNDEDGYSKADAGSYSKTTEDITLTDNGIYVFYLKSNASVSFDDIPAGTYYTLSEAGYDGYTAKLSVVENGGNTTEKKTGKEGEGVSEEKLLIGEHKNTATVTNTYKTITITGVVTHSAPFVIMVGALFVAVGGYVVLKKRIEE